MTAGGTVLVAGADLEATGRVEFSEWELTVAAWRRDPARFGMRGFAGTYPDHKRVVAEIMGRRPTDPLMVGLLERVRPNTYRLTAKGRERAAALVASADSAAPPVVPIAPVEAPRDARSMTELYDALRPFVVHPVFAAWRRSPDNPENWADARRFLLAAGDRQTHGVADRIQADAKEALQMLAEADVVALRRGKQLAERIAASTISALLDFVQALRWRFESEVAA